MDRIKITGDRALTHKKFDGEAKTTSGERIELHFQSIFQLIRLNHEWKVAGFVGYLTNPLAPKS